MKKFLVLLLAAIAPTILAADLAGTKTVALHGGDGEKVVLGELRFARQGDGYTFEFTPNSKVFGEGFLACGLCIDDKRAASVTEGDMTRPIKRENLYKST